MSARVWQVLNQMQWLETEIMWICLNLFGDKSWIHVKWDHFWRFLAIWNYCVTDQTTTRLSCLVLTWSSSRNQLAYVALSLWGRRAGTVHRLSLRKLKIKMNALVRAPAVKSGGTVSRLDWSNSRLAALPSWVVQPAAICQRSQPATSIKIGPTACSNPTLYLLE